MSEKVLVKMKIKINVKISKRISLMPRRMKIIWMVPSLARMKALKLGMSQKNLSNKFVQASGEGSEKVESTEKMTEDEKDYVGVNIMEAIEENF